MRNRIVTALIVILAIAAMAELYARWRSAESRRRVAEIEVALADTTAKLQTAREQEQRAREQRAEERAERAALEDSIEEARQAAIDAADAANRRRVQLAAGTDELIAEIEPGPLRQAVVDAVAEERAAAAEETAAMRLAVGRADSLASALRLDVASLIADTLSMRQEIDLADEQRLALDRANRALRDEIGKLQRELAPAFTTRILRTARDAAIAIAVWEGGKAVINIAGGT